MSERKKSGPKPRYPEGEKRTTLTIRVRGGMREALESAAKAANRSLSEEIERRVQMTFEADLTKQAVREALAERFPPPPPLNPFAHPLLISGLAGAPRYGSQDAMTRGSLVFDGVVRDPSWPQDEPEAV